MRHRHSVLADLAKGAAAGAIATWVMDKVTTWLYERESRQVLQQEKNARGGQSAYATAAQRLADAAGVEISDDRKAQAATSIHWATGVTAGVRYALIRRYWPDVRSGFGLPYGVGFFLVMDELMNPLLGLTPGPTAFPWQTHARGLAGHLVFGTVNDCALRVLDRAADAAA